MTEGVIEQRLQEKVLMINRVAKKVKGGERRGFAALVAVGDGKGKVGIGYGRARDLRTAIGKGKRRAKRKMFNVPITGTTVPHRVEVKEGAAQIIIKPAPRGSGLIAGGVVRNLLELAGYKDASAKILGTRNKMTNARATVKAFERLANEAR